MLLFLTNFHFCSLHLWTIICTLLCRKQHWLVLLKVQTVGNSSLVIARAVKTSKKKISALSLNRVFCKSVFEKSVPLATLCGGPSGALRLIQGVITPTNPGPTLCFFPGGAAVYDLHRLLNNRWASFKTVGGNRRRRVSGQWLLISVSARRLSSHSHSQSSQRV